MVLGNQQVMEYELLAGWVDTSIQLVVSIVSVESNRAPTQLLVTVTNADAEAEIEFAIDSTVVATLTADLDGELEMVTIPVPAALGTVGIHTLTATALGSEAGSAQFEFFEDPIEEPPIPGTPLPPAFDPDRTGWALQDPVVGGLGTWEMGISPNSHTPFRVRKTISAKHTTNVVSGQFHVTEGWVPPTDFKFGGYCPNRAFYEQLLKYLALNRRFYVIDHRQRAWVMVPVGMEIDHRRRQIEGGVENDWAANYTVHMLLVSQEPLVADPAP